MIEENGNIEQSGEQFSGKISAKKKSNHVLLTDRDLNLMILLHEHVVLSFSQIHERFFTNRTFATAMNRLKRLQSQGWIERIRVPRMRLEGRKNATGVVFQLSIKGRTIINKCRPEMDVFERCPVLNLYQLDHDLLIADIADYFKEQFQDCRWVNGRYLGDAKGFGKIPDAVLQKPGSDKVIAIELELNSKSSRRYKEIVAILKSSQRIEKVIFVTSSVAIGRKIMSEIEGFPVQNGHKFRSDFFSFVRLSECLKVKSKSFSETK